MNKKQSELVNEQIISFNFLEDMFEDDYYPNSCVEKGRDILIDLCFQIEAQNPQDLTELYELTHAATDKFNLLQDDFEANDSEIETVARECIAANFFYLANAYGFKDADHEDLIATRDW